MFQLTREWLLANQRQTRFRVEEVKILVTSVGRELTGKTIKPLTSIDAP